MLPDRHIPKRRSLSLPARRGSRPAKTASNGHSSSVHGFPQKSVDSRISSCSYILTQSGTTGSPEAQGRASCVALAALHQFGRLRCRMIGTSEGLCDAPTARRPAFSHPPRNAVHPWYAWRSGNGRLDTSGRRRQPPRPSRNPVPSSRARPCLRFPSAKPARGPRITTRCIRLVNSCWNRMGQPIPRKGGNARAGLVGA